MAYTWFSFSVVTFYVYDVSEHSAIEFNKWNFPQTVFCFCLILVTLKQLLQLTQLSIPTHAQLRHRLKFI